MGTFLETLADNWMTALYERIKKPLDEFAARTRPSRRLDWYHDEPRWIFRWNSEALTQVEVRLEPSLKFPSGFHVLLVAGQHDPSLGWKCEVVDVVDVSPFDLDPKELETRLETALGKARQLTIGAYEGSASVKKGTICYSKDEFVGLLERWLERTQEKTIGPVGSNGRTPWVKVKLTNRTLRLNADSKRDAIGRFVEYNRAGNTRWRIIKSQRDKFSKVTNAPDGKPIPGLFLYASRASKEPDEV